VVLKVEPDMLRWFGQKLGPGMSVSADVITGRRTVLQYLLSPIRGLQSNAFRERK
jgi:membrane fusion protein, adhesin transport system